MWQKLKWFLLALVGGGLTLRWATHPMGLKLALWQRAWSRRYGAVEGRKLAARVRTRYDLLRADCPYQPDRTMRTLLDDMILPGLALYQVILGEVMGAPTGAPVREPSADQTRQALQESEQLFRAAFGPNLLPARLLRLLSDPFPVFRWAMKQVLAPGVASKVWEINMVEDSPQRLAFDTQRCFTVDTLRRFGAPELAPLFCATDDWMMAEMPGAIGWRRTRTLGRGDGVCDFDWCNQA